MTRSPGPPRGLLPVLPLLALIAAAGCLQPFGRYHRVRTGETLATIAGAYAVPVERLIDDNHIESPEKIAAGDRLFIAFAATPRETRSAAAKGRGTKVEAASAPKSGAARPSAVSTGKRLAWPVAGGVLSSRFGRRGASVHDGIDISAPEGTPVLAADDGVVIYVDEAFSGYGRIVIVRHEEGMVTVYAHNKANLVGEGERVKRGQRIATVGRSGRATGPHLHFEVRADNVPVDPLGRLERSGAGSSQPAGQAEND